MAFGLPVVVSDQAVLKEVIGDAGVIVRNGDAEGLASALRTLLRDQDQWKQLSDRARQRSQLFSMSNFRQGIADLIGEVATHCQS
jgi:glycosyltransferase involved in cell wall biosynthesis